MRNGDGRNSGIMAETAGSFGTLPFLHRKLKKAREERLVWQS